MDMFDIEEYLKDKPPIVFAYWKDGELMGFRADTFGTISKTHPKIYHYTKDQVKIILNNTKDSINRVFSQLVNVIHKKGYVDNENHSLMSVTTNATEKLLREWKEFELRIHPFIEYNFVNGWIEYPSELFVQIEIKNLRPALETHKFTVVDYEN